MSEPEVLAINFGCSEMGDSGYGSTDEVEVVEHALIVNDWAGYSMFERCREPQVCPAGALVRIGATLDKVVGRSEAVLGRHRAMSAA